MEAVPDLGGWLTADQRTGASICLWPRFCMGDVRNHLVFPALYCVEDVRGGATRQITSDLTTCGLAEDVATSVVACIDARRAAVRQHLQNSAAAISSNSLTDFDWSMRVRFVCFPLYTRSCVSSGPPRDMTALCACMCVCVSVCMCVCVYVSYASCCCWVWSAQLVLSSDKVSSLHDPSLLLRLNGMRVCICDCFSTVLVHACRWRGG
jgi:hypothetical protein